MPGVSGPAWLGCVETGPWVLWALAEDRPLRSVGRCYSHPTPRCLDITERPRFPGCLLPCHTVTHSPFLLSASAPNLQSFSTKWRWAASRWQPANNWWPDCWSMGTAPPPRPIRGSRICSECLQARPRVSVGLRSLQGR